jgi:hypothetical protein
MQTAPMTLTVKGTAVANGFTYTRAITIDHTRVPNTDQTNFPVLISGTYSYLATVAYGGKVQNANGYDIIFATDPQGIQRLDHEIDSYNANGTLAMWMRFPMLSHTADTVIYMFYGNSAITTSQENKTGVWDSNYQAVWHLPNGASLSANDSTGRYNGTISGATATPGEIDGAANFNGSNQFINAGGFNLGATSVTVEVWAKSATMTSQNGMLVNKEPVNLDWNFLLEGGSVKLRGATGTQQVAVGAPSNNAWHHLVGLISGTTASIYIDGVFAGSATTVAVANTTNPLDIGSGGGYYFNGALDEVRISNAARSADWITTEYNNQNLPSTFYSLSSEASASAYLVSAAPGAVTVAAGSSAANTITVGGFNGTVALSVSTLPAGITGTFSPASIASSGTSTLTLTASTSVVNGTYALTVTGTSGCTMQTAPMTLTVKGTAYANGFTYTRAITIDHTKVPNTDQTNFPVLVSGAYNYLGACPRIPQGRGNRANGTGT